MLSASLYIVACSTRNRIAVRLRRLREPRYLVGAALGALYLFFLTVEPRRAVRGRGAARQFSPALALGQFGLSLGSVALLLLSAVAWLLPSSSRLLHFTEAEVSFLFPAPVSRRELLVHRLIRSQLGLLFAAMLPAILFGPSGASTSVTDRLLFGIALWVMLAAARVHFAGVSMARDHLGSTDSRGRAVAWAPLLVTVGALAGVGIVMAREVSVPVESVSSAIARIAESSTAGAPRFVLLPYRLLLGPFFAKGALEYVTRLVGSLLVLLATVVWVFKSEEVFKTIDIDHLLPAPPARRGRTGGAPTLRWSRWTLPLVGRPEAMLFWKNGLATLRSINAGSVVPIVILLAYALVGARVGMSADLKSAVCLASLMIASFGMLLGPGSVMSDLRGDLRHIELLKTWPVEAGALLRGEMLWPGSLVTAGVWLALTCAVVLSPAAFPQLPFAWRFSLYAVAIIMTPAFVFAQYTIHQAAAILFPAWVPTDGRARGLESMAQRLILFAGVVLALVAMLAPGAVAGGAAAFVVYRLTASPLALIPAAAAGLVVVAVEVVLASEALGGAYERIDVSEVERVE